MTEDNVIGGLFGVCVGDALGFPVQFKPRREVDKDPITDMADRDDKYGYPPGTWSDDSSLTFCLAESLCNGFDIQDIADKFVKWFDEGYWTPYGRAFDIGITTKRAIINLKNGVNPLKAGINHEENNGNGSLMRILPLTFYLEEYSLDKQFELAHQVSSITHRHLRSQMACGMYIQMALNLLRGLSPRSAYEKMKEVSLKYYSKSPYNKELVHFSRILDYDISKLDRDSINSGGYVIDTLEASLWCFLNGSSYKESVLTAVNLGNDADTTGATTGGLAGIYYGYAAIPSNWTKKIARRDDIMQLAKRLFISLSSN